MQFIQECCCLERGCNRPHAFFRAWICICDDPTCKEPVHYAFDEADEKIKVETLEKIEKIEKVESTENY